MKEALASVSRENKKIVRCGRSPKGYGFAIFALKNIMPGEVVSHGYGKLSDQQTSNFSIQIGLKTHIIPSKWTGKYWNHSCEPNCYVKTRENGFPTLFALREIKSGEEIVYGYYMTEFTWSEKAVEATIPCKCGSAKCRGKIPSFSQLTSKEKKKYFPYLSSYLKKLT